MVRDDDRSRPSAPGDEQGEELEPQDQFEWGESVGLSVEDVWVAYDSAPALRGVSLEVAGGELVALLGPSGSGKTTLLRVIAGLAFTDRGTVRLGDEDASSIPVQRRRIGLVFQHYALFRHMRVEDNVAFGLRVRPRSSRPAAGEIRQRTRALIEIMRLEGLERRFPQQLSGGQRQRVALARALAIQPRVLLLDEPFGALDAKVRRELRRALRDIHDRTGYTTVFVTHDQEEALEIADRVVVMNEGAIEQVGTPDEIYGAPASRFVFEFIGNSNMLPVEVRGGLISFAGRALALRAGAGMGAGVGAENGAEDGVGGVPAGASRPDGPALLGFRPHHVEVRPSPEGALFGVVIVARQAAGWRRVELRLTSGAVIEVDLAEEDKAAVGDRLAVLPSRWMLLDAD